MTWRDGVVRMFNVKDGTSFNEDTDVTCPVCGGQMVHITRVRVGQGNYWTEINRNETKASDVNIPGKIRNDGSVVEIEFMGECGHRWWLYFRFHEGVVISWIEMDDKEYSIDYIFQKELWRS